MIHATRIIIEEQDKIILIKRRKKINGRVQEFYVVPGGMLDEGENYIDAGIREAKEELDVEIEIQDFLDEIYIKELDKLERYYFAKIISGKIKNGNGIEFQNQSINSEYGTYDVVKINKKELGAYKILPVEVKDKLVSMYI